MNGSTQEAPLDVPPEVAPEYRKHHWMNITVEILDKSPDWIFGGMVSGITCYSHFSQLEIMIASDKFLGKFSTSFDFGYLSWTPKTQSLLQHIVNLTVFDGHTDGKFSLDFLVNTGPETFQQVKFHPKTYDLLWKGKNWPWTPQISVQLGCYDIEMTIPLQRSCNPT